MRKPELLSPAGDWEKLQMAVLYGADAVYLAGTRSDAARGRCAGLSRRNELRDALLCRELR